MMQNTKNYITDTCNSYNGEEFIEEVRKGDKTLTYYKRKSTSPTSDEYRPTSDEYRSTSPSIEEYPLEDDENVHWRSEDNLLPTHEEIHCKSKNIANHNGEESATNPSSQSAKQQQCNGSLQDDADNGDMQHYQTNTLNSTLPPVKYSSSSLIENQFQSEYLQKDEGINFPSGNSSVESRYSAGRKYLDLSLDHCKQPASECPDLQFHKGSPHSGCGQSVNTKHMPYTSNDYYVAQSRRNTPSGLVTFPFDHAASKHKLNNKTHQQYASNLSIDVAKRKRQICKYVAIFSILVVSIICIVSGLLYYYVDFYPEIFHLNAGDVKLLSVSRFFCSKVTAMSLASDLHIITFSKKSNEVHKKNRFIGNLEVYPSDVWYRDFYLQAGSSVSLSFKSVYSVDVIVFEGEKEYIMWTQHKKSKSYLKTSSCCFGTKEAENTTTFTAQFDSRYFIVVYNKIENIPVAVRLEIILDRVYYDFSHTTQQCLSKSNQWCSISLTFSGDDDVALQVPLPKDLSKIPQSSEVKWECIARVWFYVLVFLLPFIIAAGLITCIYCVSIRFKHYCCVPNHFDEKCVSSEFLYLNKHHINSIIENSPNAKNIARHTRPSSLGKAKKLDIPRLHNPYEHSKYHFDTLSQCVSLDPELMHRQEIMQLQELQVQQLKSQRINQKQQHQFEIANGPRVKQLLSQSKQNVSSELCSDESGNYGARSAMPRRYSFSYEVVPTLSKMERGQQLNILQSVASIYHENEGVRHGEVIQISGSDSDLGSECSPELSKVENIDQELYQFTLSNPVRRRPSSDELFV